MTIGLICALPQEGKLLREKMAVETIDELAGRKFFFGTLNKKRIVLAFSGVGKVSAALTTQLTVDRFSISRLIFFGTAGSLSNVLQVGDIVVGTEAVQHDVDFAGVPLGQKNILHEGRYWYPCDELMLERAGYVISRFQSLPVFRGEKRMPRVFMGPVLTGDRAVVSSTYRQKLNERFSAMCVEMEGAAAAQVCFANQIPFLLIRGISDEADEHTERQFWDNIERAAEVVGLFIECFLEK
ncbi:5'-methylthioadenosine/adenosylhomocysteine nucleosidase [Calderihabitans maritimus]|uniref:adenosylhomocysteine nucleosidase n=1 Tax=Calderihabitans maritimus TaxID=1246530 RepID=A0A1Z5HPP4_9FIRM|nr:5'-methylthioadenosine/adenosylhomocysteine nucleosidase [Calderihabitans maritimus]GAW91502.1 5'-methylthioadenosine nucleosidase [Calderihabitans maritimus]